MPQTDRPNALVVAYLAKRPDLLRFFTLRLRSAAAAEDLVQEIFVKIAGIEDGADILNPVAYLYRLGSNLMLDRVRGARRAAARDSDWRESHHAQVGPEDVVDQPAADEVVAGRQRLELIISALSDLPALTQTIFRLHKFDGLSHSEVAQQLAISRSSVEKHVSSALKHLLLALDRQ